MAQYHTTLGKGGGGRWEVKEPLGRLSEAPDWWSEPEPAGRVQGQHKAPTRGRAALCCAGVLLLPQVALQRLAPGRDFDNNLVWRGWSKMATPSTAFRITQVRVRAGCGPSAALQRPRRTARQPHHSCAGRAVKAAPAPPLQCQFCLCLSVFFQYLSVWQLQEGFDTAPLCCAVLPPCCRVAVAACRCPLPVSVRSTRPLCWPK